MSDTPRQLRPADPELERLKLTHQIDVEDKKIAVETDEREFKHKFYWESCCLRIDKRAITYFSQMTFSAVIIAFCISMLVANQNCETFSRYSPLLTFVVGYLMPQPALKND